MILDKIAQVKREEVAQGKLTLPLSQLKEQITGVEPARDFASALSESGTVQVIAEIKKASPSKGVLCPNFDPISLALSYQAGGAAALSVLTDESFFQGQLSFLRLVREPVTLPLLRKDFLIDPYQIYQARAAQADAVLLIARLLSPSQLAEFLALTRELGMEALVEVHDEQDLEHCVAAGARVIGINNRDLATFITDLKVTEELAPKVPAGCILVSESGIQQPEDLRKLKRLGVSAVLVGEALVKEADVTAATARLVSGGR